MSYWCASRDEECFEGEYATREEAIEEYQHEYDLEPGTTFWTGHAVPFQPRKSHFAWAAIERLQEDAYDLCGEHAESYLNGVTPKQRDQLDEQIGAVVEAWLKEHKLEAKFSQVVEVQEHVVPEPEAEPSP